MTVLTVLGSGAAVPAARRAPPGCLITAEDGAAYLDDPGPGATNYSESYDRWHYYERPRSIDLGVRIFFCP